MTSTTATSPISVKRETPMLSPRGWGWTILLGASFVVLFIYFIQRMFNIAMDRWGGDWSHAVVIPFISVYYLYLKRDVIASTPRRVFWPGLAIFFFGLFSYAWWIFPGRNDMLQGYSMIIALFGLVLFLFGPRMMMTLWFPIAYLVFAVKVSDRIWALIAAKMQVMASHLAKHLLFLANVEADVRGTTIHLYKNFVEIKPPLNVAEACAGLRMLMAFMALGVAMAFLFDRAWWQRLIMVALTLPIAIAVNAGRVTTLGLIRIYGEQQAAEGDTHKAVGLVMLIPAVLIFLLVGWVLDRIVITDENEMPRKLPPPIDANEGPINWPAIREGVIGGAMLTVFLGLAYLLFFASLKPGVIGEWLTPALAKPLLAVALVLFGGTWYLLRRRTKQGTPERIRTLPRAIAAGVMVTAILGLWGTITANGHVVIKKPIALREQLYRLPDQLGKWKKLGDEPPISAEMLEELGTTQYLSRHYVDNSNPDAPVKVRLHIAYYTGTPDTVPHVPDRCFTAAGLDYLSKTTSPIALKGEQYVQGPEGWSAKCREPMGRTHIPATDFNLTVFSYRHPLEPEKQSNVTYFFSANGKFLSSPDAVRLYGFDPRDVYSYYCKIEINMDDVRDPEAAAKRSEDFLSAAVPEIMACLPDWVEVQQGKYPPKNGAAATAPPQVQPQP